MHVALVHIKHANSGGVEAYLTNLARYLANSGHEVSIICHRHAEAPHPAVKFVRLRPLHIGGATKLWAFAKAVERHVATVEYDVVYGLGKTWSHDLIRMGGGCCQTYLDLVGGCDRRRFPPPVHLWLRDRVALEIEARSVAPENCRLVIANSEMVKRDVCARHGVSEERVTVIHNGVDAERFHLRNRADVGARLRHECGFGPEEQVALFLGTGYARKGLDLILEAMPDVLRRRPGMRLLIVGYDAAVERYRRLARTLGIEQATRFLGGRSDVAACYGAADFYVLPTRYDPFANTTLEAMASGLPVITSDSNGGSEVVTAGRSGDIIAYSELRDKLGEAMFAWSNPERLANSRHLARSDAERHLLEDKLRQSTELLLRLAESKAARC